MNVIEILLISLAAFLLLPILSYMVMKFGVVGYLRGKYTHRKHKHQQTHETD